MSINGQNLSQNSFSWLSFRTSELHYTRPYTANAIFVAQTESMSIFQKFKKKLKAIVNYYMPFTIIILIPNVYKHQNLFDNIKRLLYLWVKVIRPTLAKKYCACVGLLETFQFIKLVGLTNPRHQ